MYYGHMGVFGGFGMLLFWGLFIWLIVWLIQQNRKEDDPKIILKNRLANGEITEKEYERILKKVRR